MKPAIALAAVAALFVFGTVVGAMGMHLHHHGGHNDGLLGRLHGDSRGGEHTRHCDQQANLTELLDLTTEQRGEVTRIMDDAHRESRALHEQLLPQVTAHIERVHERIRDVLDAEQREVFAELLERDSRRMQHIFLAGPSCERHGEPGR